jgi:PST family polysaccharide transporter
VAIFNAIHVSVFAAAAWLLLSSFGIIGYGYAELCAIPTYVALDILLRRRLGSPSYAMVLSWYVPIAAAILLHAFAWWTACVVLVPLAWQRNRTTVILFIRRSRSVMQFDQIT